MKELSDEQFDKRAGVLIAAYAELVKQGLPEAGLAKWNATVDKLPETAQETIREIVSMSPTLIGAIAGKEDFQYVTDKSRVPGAPSRW